MPIMFDHIQCLIGGRRRVRLRADDKRQTVNFSPESKSKLEVKSQMSRSPKSIGRLSNMQGVSGTDMPAGMKISKVSTATCSWHWDTTYNQSTKINQSPGWALARLIIRNYLQSLPHHPVMKLMIFQIQQYQRLSYLNLFYHYFCSRGKPQVLIVASSFLDTIFQPYEPHQNPNTNT